jgi:hypothetical protein
MTKHNNSETTNTVKTKKSKAKKKNKQTNGTKPTSELIKEASNILFGETYTMASGQSNGQLGSHPPFPGTFYTPVGLQQATDQSTPFWVHELFQKLGNIEARITNMDEKLKKLDTLEAELKNMKKELTSTNNEVTRINKKQTELAEKTEGLEFEMGITQDAFEQVAQTNANLKAEIIDLKSRSMRDNLLFSMWKKKKTRQQRRF